MLSSEVSVFGYDNGHNRTFTATTVCAATQTTTTLNNEPYNGNKYYIYRYIYSLIK
jgi:hypothetical protein